MNQVDPPVFNLVSSDVTMSVLDPLIIEDPPTLTRVEADLLAEVKESSRHM